MSLLLALVVLLASVYMLTYSGRIESGDSLMVFDAVGSLVKFGDTRLDLSLWYNPPPVTALRQSGPMNELEVESLKPNLQVVLAAPLYWLADRLPGIGLVHTVWLFNVLVTAATGGLLFVYALALGYSEATSIGAALILGLGTVLFPYSKTFFRDPLTVFMVLFAAFLIERLRAGGYRSPLLWLGTALALYGILMTKTTAAFAFPALLVVGLPRLHLTPFSQRTRAVLSAAAPGLPFIGIALLVFSPLLDYPPNYEFPFIRQLNVSPYFMRTALHGYLFSAGGSVWGTSPVVLLGLPGAWILYRRRQHRYVWAAVLITIAYAFGYALLSNKHWFGGVSWPPRFLLPVIPFILIVSLPVLDRIWRRPVSRWAAAAAGILLLYSLWIQLSAVSLEWHQYTDALPPEAHKLIEWGPGLNTIQYLRWVIIPALWFKTPLDFVWTRVDVPGWAVSFTALALLSLGVVWAIFRGWKWIRRWGTLLLPVSFVVVTGIGLSGIAADPVYLGNYPALHAMLDIVESRTHSGDILLLSNNTYERFFLNHARLDTRIITLPFQPGESQPLDAVSDNPDVLVSPETGPLIFRLAEAHERLWLLVDSGPFITASVRPVERFMTMHYFPLRELQTDPPDPALRLMEYSTAAAPNPYAFRGPDTLTDLVYGESMRLAGFNLPSGLTYKAGDALTISLYWEADSTLDADYTVAWFLVDAAGTPVAQGMDSQPGGGFAPTGRWQPGVPVWDNRALRLPPGLLPGDYRLWVAVYALTANGELQRLPVTGAEVVDELCVGVLPATIRVE